MNARISDLRRLELDGLHEDLLLLATDLVDKETVSIRVGDLRKYLKERPKYKSKQVLWEAIPNTPQPQSYWKRLKRTLGYA